MLYSSPGCPAWWCKPWRRCAGRRPAFSAEPLETRLVPADVAVKLQGLKLSVTGNEDGPALNIQLTATELRITAGNGTTTFNGNPNFIHPIDGPVALKLKLTGYVIIVSLAATEPGREFASINATLGAGADLFRMIDSVVLGKTLIKAGGGDNRVRIQSTTFDGQLQVKAPGETDLTVIESLVNGVAKLTLGAGSEMEIAGRSDGTATQFNDRFFAILGSGSFGHFGPDLNFADAVSLKGKGQPRYGVVGVTTAGNDRVKGCIAILRRQSVSGDVPIAIPAIGTVTSTLVATQSGPILDVNVSLNLAHSRDDDLDIVLISPTGIRILLTSDNGGGSDDYKNTAFNDEAVLAVIGGAGPFSRTFRPEGLLSDLDGAAAAGTWTLEITDDAPGAAGTLLGWSLTITSNTLVPTV